MASPSMLQEVASMISSVSGAFFILSKSGAMRRFSGCILFMGESTPWRTW